MNLSMFDLCTPEQISPFTQNRSPFLAQLTCGFTNYNKTVGFFVINRSENVAQGGHCRLEMNASVPDKHLEC